MSTGHYVRLDGRGIITVAGKDRLAFLQGLVTNDVAACGADHAIWAALLTPQGKFLHDFFMTDHDGIFWLDCEAGRLMDLGQRLRRYKLRAEIDLNIGQNVAAYVLPDGDPALFGLPGTAGAAKTIPGGVIYVDPRLATVGLRAVGDPVKLELFFRDSGLEQGGLDQYERARIGLGLPDGSRDMSVEKATLLENGFEELGGVDFQKGCYMGQELTARMKYRGLVKKRLLPFEAEDDLFEEVDVIMADGREIAEIRSRAGRNGLALVRLDRWREAMASGKQLEADKVAVRLIPQSWMRLPEEKQD
ncbi:YgfZ/GcvT domain-containing protein [Aestuariispira insulae]|uniref:CAF17 C-terminal domain-containing protein n=1 Tax=Aestuariispira insulae TaxID=1461337 RepID=A0A3D9HTQ4_9PROT|nr:folate-binding protein YgfZ [Aestuariispira insulae]RED52256.1 hypothetical protein DFP90_102274 [Aestuariispira insulae]